MPEDFTLSNARRFYSSKGDPLGAKGLRLNDSPVGHIHKIFLSTGVEHKLAMEAHAGGIS